MLHFFSPFPSFYFLIYFSPDNCDRGRGEAIHTSVTHRGRNHPYFIPPIPPRNWDVRLKKFNFPLCDSETIDGKEEISSILTLFPTSFQHIVFSLWRVVRSEKLEN